jgi:hypothetical protein
VNIRVALRDDLVRRIDRLVGPRRRAAFVARAVERALDGERRWELIWSAVGTIQDHGHDWDRGPRRWVRHQRRGG